MANCRIFAKCMFARYENCIKIHLQDVWLLFKQTHKKQETSAYESVKDGNYD